MEKMILSLKNIYMLLMTEDFPIYSEGVISRSDRRGLTMLRFWQGQIAEEFRSLPRGKMLWRNDGKRNRYTSYLCNRSAEIKTYAEYAQELASQVNISSLRNQIDRFMDFLSAGKYRHDILLRRLFRLADLVCDSCRNHPERACRDALRSAGKNENTDLRSLPDARSGVFIGQTEEKWPGNRRREILPLFRKKVLGNLRI